MDETVPLLRDEALEVPIKAASTDPNIVDFDPKGDSENPRDWPITYKWGIVSLLAFMSFTVTFTCISVVPIANGMIADLNGGKSQKSASVLLVTIWELGEAAGPLLIAPLSEVVGRYPVMNACNLLFIVAIALAGVSQSVPLLIGARALTGLAVASNVLNPAIVGDIFTEEHRGSAMSLIMLAPLTGGAVGPAISGAIAQDSGWRKVLLMCGVLAGFAELLFLLLFKETYKVPILRRRVDRLRKETGNHALRTSFDAQDEGNANQFRDSILRPLLVFWDSSILQAISLFGSLLFTYFYILTTTLPDVLIGIYGLSPAMTGVAFISFSIGSAGSIIVMNLTLDRIFIKLRKGNKGVGLPEYRLPLAILGAFTMPFLVMAFGWIAEYRLPLPILLIDLALIGNTTMFGFLPVTAYVVDASKLYAASAMTALIVTRCLMGTFLPLTTAPLVRQFGFGYAFTLLGGASLVLAPIPVFIFKYGAKWRQSSKYTADDADE
ncbi:hypothetical protein LTR84_010973 [Exophiala bonariae]|uniref:Major facilitator superfamily (MFS) profile domain-containing protein n=1 Tax=Exophiala bonariae TaxID=1690606 RepID=A0AAV9NM83_9EURO|nr:hypothetical protein LTR84_010973 [Exophiala bonariae]